jgi:hypothetical protein
MQLGRVFPRAPCAASGRICSTTASSAQGRICSTAWLVSFLDVSFLQHPVLSMYLSGLQQPVLHLDVPVLYTSLCFTRMCLFNSSLCCAKRFLAHFAAPRRVRLNELMYCAEHGRACLQGPVLHLYMCFLPHMDVFVYKSYPVLHLCDLSTRAIVRHLNVSIHKSMCCTCTCALCRS